jgi:hypothetical protein
MPLRRTSNDWYPNVRSPGTGIPPPSVCTSGVQIIAAVLLATASLGPGDEIGLSTNAALDLGEDECFHLNHVVPLALRRRRRHREASTLALSDGAVAADTGDGNFELVG